MLGDGMEHVAAKIINQIIATYGDNLTENENGAVVVESLWIKDMKAVITAALTDYECERLALERPRAAARMARLEQRVITLEKELTASRDKAERLRDDAELGQLVREKMPRLAGIGGRCTLVCYPESERTVWNVNVWRAGRTTQSMDPKDHLTAIDALRAAEAMP